MKYFFGETCVNCSRVCFTIVTCMMYVLTGIYWWCTSSRLTDIATWTTSSYIARVISSVLEQVTSEAEYLPAELQYRCLEYFLGEWLEAFNHHLLAVKNIKFRCSISHHSFWCGIQSQLLQAQYRLPHLMGGCARVYA